jgi:hypothetical protein
MVRRSEASGPGRIGPRIWLGDRLKVRETSVRIVGVLAKGRTGNLWSQALRCDGLRCVVVCVRTFYQLVTLFRVV